MIGDSRVRNLPAMVVQNDHHVKQLERRARHDEHIDRGDAGGVIVQEAAPVLRRRSSPSYHLLGDRSLADFDAELKESHHGSGVLPKSGLAAFICRISLRTSRSTDGRPDLERQRQSRRNP